MYFPIYLTWPKFRPAFPRTSKHMFLFTGQAQAGRISARSFKTLNNVTEMDTFQVFWKLAEIEASFSIGSIGNMHVYIHFLTLLAKISASFWV